MNLRRLRGGDESERDAVAALICESTNAWYARRGMGPIFPGGPASCRVFPDVYERLDPGCCVLAEEEGSGRLMGSCFYHPRLRHMSLGIMNVHPDFAGIGVAGRLLQFVLDLAEEAHLQVRLVSSAMNLDSYSLYTRAGFVPRAVFQDMYVDVPTGGVLPEFPRSGRVRPATRDDVAAMVALEMEIAGIHREKDFRFFLENEQGIWHGSVIEGAGGRGLDGFLFSCSHPATNMLGPGVARVSDDEDLCVEYLILAELDRYRGRRPVFLVPADQRDLVRSLYAMGARNCELHFAQMLGYFEGFQGIVMPTFMPETG